MTAEAEISAEAAQAFNTANKAAREGRHDEVIAHCNLAITAAPGLVLAYVLKARSLLVLNRSSEAKACYEEAVALDPENFSAQLELGNVFAGEGDGQSASACYRWAIKVRPADSRGHLALSLLLQSEDDPKSIEHAARHYHLAAHFAELENPEEGAARVDYKLGVKRFALDQAEKAREALICALLRLAPLDEAGSALKAEISLDLAQCLLRLGLDEVASGLLERAARSSDVGVLKRTAEVSFRQNYWQESLAILGRAVDLNPDSVDLRLDFAEMAVNSWQVALAEQTLEKISGEQTAQQRFRTGLLQAKIAIQVGDADHALNEFGAVADLDRDSLISSRVMASLYSNKSDPAEWIEKTKQVCTAWGREARPVSSFSNARGTGRPLRIGMVSADIHRQHPVDIFLQPMLAEWNNRDFPLTIYHTGQTTDARTRLAKERAGQWRSLTAQQLPQAVAADEIDILIDLCGHTHSSELKQFAGRMAPVQATYLGFPGSTGVPNIDFLIGDHIVTPQEHAALYSERLMPLDTNVFCYAPGDEYPYPDFAGPVQDRIVTFGSFNNIPKLNQHTLDLWSEILKQLPAARLLLKAPSFRDGHPAVAHIKARFAERGVDAGRLVLRGPSGLADMMAEYADVDIALDPIPYNGGTTTHQAMWMGAPAVVMAGGQFVSRMGASFMTHAGLPDWVAQTEADYVRIAVEKASDRKALWDLKRGLRDHLRGQPGWNITSFTRGFENALQQMWQEAG